MAASFASPLGVEQPRAMMVTARFFQDGSKKGHLNGNISYNFWEIVHCVPLPGWVLLSQHLRLSAYRSRPYSFDPAAAAAQVEKVFETKGTSLDVVGIQKIVDSLLWETFLLLVGKPLLFSEYSRMPCLYMFIM